MRVLVQPWGEPGRPLTNVETARKRGFQPSSPWVSKLAEWLNKLPVCGECDQTLGNSNWCPSCRQYNVARLLKTSPLDGYEIIFRVILFGIIGVGAAAFGALYVWHKWGAK